MKRQSTTSRITRKIAHGIMDACKRGGGVIVRHRGVEYGVVRVIRTASGYVAKTWEGVTLALSGCTVRKTTIRFIPAVTLLPVQPLADTFPMLAPAESAGTFNDILASVAPMGTTEHWQD